MYMQISAFACGFLSTVSVVVTCFWNQWAVTSAGASSSLLNSIWGFRGIWSNCIQYTTGQFQCENDMTAMFEIPGYLIAIRAFMCIGIVISTMTCFITLIGLQCSKVMEENPASKRKLMLLSGFLHAITAMLTLASVAWYTGLIIQEYFSFTSQDNAFRYELGATIYLGYSSSLLSLISCFSCFCMAGPREKTTNYILGYEYKNSNAGFGENKALSEYV